MKRNINPHEAMNNISKGKDPFLSIKESINFLNISSDFVNISLVSNLYIGTLNLNILRGVDNMSKICRQIEHKTKEKREFEKMLAETVDSIRIINSEVSDILSEYVSPFKIELEKVLIWIINKNNIFLYNERKNEKKYMLLHTNTKTKNCFVSNSNIISNLYFNEKIELLSWLNNKKRINTLEYLKCLDFISELQYKFWKQKYKNRQNINMEIFNEIVNYLKKVKNYRNIVSHNDLYFINKHNMNELHAFLSNQEMILKNEVADKAIKKISESIKKIIILNNRINDNSQFLSIYSSYISKDK